jgi:sulfate transport system permease protein
MRYRVIPGMPLALGVTVLYVSLIICLPIGVLLFKAGSLGFEQYWRIVTAPRALASYRVTLLSAFGATVFNTLFGFLLAWVLVRYRFPGRRFLDALVDLPFALPTAVAGIALTTLFAAEGWFGAPLEILGIQVVYTPLGIMIAMAFTSLPFVVRSVQPVLHDLEPSAEEAAQTLGASEIRTFRQVLLPLVMPALLAGASLAFARSLGEFGAVIFIAGNQPNSTEITALLAFIRLEEFSYESAAAIASVMLIAAFLMLALTNALQALFLRRMVG